MNNVLIALFHGGLALSGLPILAASLYLATLAALSRARPLPANLPPHLKFDVVVPAHNEEAEIGPTVGSLLSIDYPRHLFRVVVVADNCNDSTAERATASGARVLVRTDPVCRGKGYALSFAFDRCLADAFADVIVVVDADTTVTTNLLRAFAARFETGAAAVQAEYAVRNPTSSWRTRIMTIAFAAFHGVRSLARERLALSCGLRGNGMGFSAHLLQAVPHTATSIVEDVEYGIQLGYAGVRVEYVPEARVFGQMVVGERASRSQRRRWESGRRTLVRQHALRLLSASWRRRDPVLLDLALDLLVPPIAELAALNGVGLVFCLALGWSKVGSAYWIWSVSAAGLCLYVMRGWSLSGVGARGLADLLCAPFYVIWKLTMRLRSGRREKAWVRTTREVRM